MRHSQSFTPEQLHLARELHVDPLIIVLLVNRGICTREEIVDFLNPSLASLPHPFEFSGVRRAVALILQTITAGERIVIWGDYDVDGISATALLVNFFLQIETTVTYHIPDRLTDGYGLNSRSLVALRKRVGGENPLLITVDCGISNHAEIDRARELGFRTIVTDHHEVPEKEVAADVVINPKAVESAQPFQNLAGVGVAFYLAAGVRTELMANNFFSGRPRTPPNMKWFLSFVALGTIADMVPLSGMNRILVKAGFEALLTTDHCGLSALLISSDIHGKLLTADDIGFTLAPKINAAGRIGKAETAVKLLVCQVAEEGVQLAEKLARLNKKRRMMTQEVFEQTVEHARTLMARGDSCIVIEGDFHQGVIGIVASRLAEKFQVPVILFSRCFDETGSCLLKGSARSVEGINLFSVLKQCERYFIRFGGHRMAAGLSILEENFSGLKEILNSLIAMVAPEERSEGKVRVDVAVGVETVFSPQFLKQLQLLEPYGEGNRQPVFYDEQSEPVEMVAVGHGGAHIKVRFRGKVVNHQGIGFGLGHQLAELREQRTHPMIYSPMLNRFHSAVSWQVKILSIQ